MTDGFEGALEDAEGGMVLDLAPESSSLLVAFGGIANQMAVPPFEFFRLASALEAKQEGVPQGSRSALVPPGGPGVEH